MSTMSRGALIATSVSAGTVVLLSYARHVKAMNFLKVFQLTAIIGILVVTGFFFNTKLVDYFSFQSDVFSDRLSEDRMDGGVDIRQEIWAAGISGLEGGEIVYGHGLSSFRFLAKKSGIDYYAHSVYIDTITSTGLLGFATLLSLLIYLLYNIRKSKSKLSFALFVYLLFNYATHGTITSMLFWFSLALSLALATPILKKKYSNS
jgi:O-antigen ligase